MFVAGRIGEVFEVRSSVDLLMRVLISFSTCLRSRNDAIYLVPLTTKAEGRLNSVFFFRIAVLAGNTCD